MRLFILSILAIGSVHSLTIGYPYRSALLAYSPGRGEFPVQSAEVQGYLRYFDSNGVEHLVSYSQPEPTLGVRQVAGISRPVVRAYNIDPATYPKAIEGHFRAWITVQYKALRDEIDALKAQGKEPSADMLFRLQPLEKIYQTADFSTIAELPEVKRLFDEHSRIYKVKTELLPQPIGEIKTYTTSTNVPLVPVIETPEQRLAREEHLRIYNEQVAHLRKLQAQPGETVIEASNEAQIGQTKIADQQPINRLAGKADGITEVERATQEHLRLWNEAKLRAENANYQQEGIVEAGGLNTNEQRINKQANFEIVQHLPSIVQEPDEILKARAEHLRLVNEATLRSQNANAVENSQGVENFIPMEHQQNFQLRTSAPLGQHQVQQPQQHHIVVDTPEVVRAREDHLRLVNEARLRAQSVEEEESKHKQFVNVPLLKAPIPHTQLIHAHIPTYAQAAQPAPTVDTPEVVKAREEHLRFVNEAQQKVQPIEQPQYDQPQVAETPEVTKARQEHLRIFNEIKSQAEQEQAKMSEIKAAGIELKSHQSSEESEKIQEQERLNEEARLLELERIRESQRLQEEQKQLELQQRREAERFAEEQRQMEAEIMRLQLEEEQRLEMEKLIESRRLKAEQEQAQQIIITEEFKPIEEGQAQQPLFFSNPMQTMQQQIIQQQLAQQQPIQQQMYVNNPFLKSPATEGQTIQQQLQQVTMPLAQPQQQQQQQPTITTISFPSESRKIQSSQNSIGTKQQHIKDDFIKHQTIDHAGYQPADTAAVLIHLEKARQEHFRAHDQALEQLRLARVHSSSLKDCN